MGIVRLAPEMEEKRRKKNLRGLNTNKITL